MEDRTAVSYSNRYVRQRKNAPKSSLFLPKEISLSAGFFKGCGMLYSLSRWSSMILNRPAEYIKNRTGPRQLPYGTPDPRLNGWDIQFFIRTLCSLWDYFKRCTIIFSTFLLPYPSFFHLKECFYSDFGPSALRLRMKESAIIFAANDVWYGEDMREHPR